MALDLRSKLNASNRAALLRTQDRGAWEQMVTQQHGRLFNLLLRLTGDREVAADLTQETFVAAYRSAHTVSGRALPETWLYGVALNCLRNWRRRAGKHDPPDELSDGLPDPAPTVEDLAALRERSDLICGAVRDLPDPYRRAVALRYFAGLPATEIALAEGVEAGTVRWRLHQAMRKLWTVLEPQIGERKEEQ